ncbi:MAG: PIG-L family deacetylase [Cyclobacteriaceae bacterium]|nr:PIG-L family deacetylase [Cyclobacteriaceae bacterium]
MHTTRREFVKRSTVGLGLLSPVSGVSFTAETKKMKVVCVGGHPDDPESGCGGTLARLSRAGHDVSVIYLTRGEAGIAGKSHAEAGTVRTNEAEAACSILKVKPIFAGQVDGDTMVNREWIEKIAGLISKEMPDVVFTHWPIDSHRDHQAASFLTIQAWVRAKVKFDLYFFEVCAGEQTMAFRPTDYVDITDVQEIKREALYCHVSQDPPGIYACGHTIMEQFRGREMGAKAAEAFVRMAGSGMEL